MHEGDVRPWHALFSVHEAILNNDLPALVTELIVFPDYPLTRVHVKVASEYMNAIAADASAEVLEQRRELYFDSYQAVSLALAVAPPSGSSPDSHSDGGGVEMGPVVTQGALFA